MPDPRNPLSKEKAQPVGWAVKELGGPVPPKWWDPKRWDIKAGLYGWPITGRFQGGQLSRTPPFLN
jgi:hypothetical protein